MEIKDYLNYSANNSKTRTKTSIETKSLDYTFFKTILPKATQYYYAELFFKLNEKEYIYYSSDNVWYGYNKNNTLKLSNGVPVNLNNQISKCLQNFLDYQFEKVERCELYEKDYNRNRKNLGTTNFVKGIIEKLADYYNDDDVNEKIDTNCDLLAFKDVLYDLKLKRFRPIERTDYICKHIKYKIKPEKRGNKKIRADIMKFLSSIMPDTENVNFLIKVFSTSLFWNVYEKLFMLVGIGGNGKGVLISLLEQAVGKYFKSTSSQFLTSKYRAGSPNPSLYECMNKRMVVVNEPEENEGDNGLKFNLEFLKKITSNDTVETRQLYRTNVEFKAKFTTLVQTNELPKLDKIDEGVKRRFVCIDFPYQFKENPNKNNKFEKKADYSLKRKFSNVKYHREFMKLLLENVNIENELNIPKSVINRTTEYLNENNHTLLFMEDNYDRSPNKKDKVLCADLYKEFKSWSSVYLSATNFHKQMKKNKFIQHKSGSRYYINIKPKIDEEEQNIDVDIDI